ncbi:MAG: glycosyltransferase family 9 protein, partial [Candidatus Omnitrophica bacterium]|nr:glycosyltransferase family 9 protein [Candidatus Omnitrophota bacterium]
FNSNIVFVGGDETSEYTKKAVSSMKYNAVDLTGMLLIGELAEFLSRCKIFISNDSGPVHVSVAVGTPVVAVFGRRDAGLSPVRWGPLGAIDVFIHKPPACDPCLAHNCDKDFACLKRVTVDGVVEAASKILEGSWIL